MRDNGYQIIKEGNKYSILLENSNESLIKSITKTKIILGSTIMKNYTVMSFHANNIQTLKEYYSSGKVSYNIFMRLIYCLSVQLKYLIEICHKAFIGYSPEHIMVINNDRFIYMNVNQLRNIHHECIDITYPFSPNDFYMSPEHRSIEEIPTNIHYKACYYSLACLIIDGYSNHKYDLKDANNILELLPIQETKLYYLLKRCLSEDITNRCILYI